MNNEQRIAESNVLTGPDDPVNGPAKRFLKRVFERRVQPVPPLPKIEPPSACGRAQSVPGPSGATESVSRKPPAMFTKPPLGSGQAGPTPFDPENDPEFSTATRKG